MRENGYYSNGELKYYGVENLLKTYYETQNSNEIKIQKEKRRGTFK